jgi:hypothetical protein
MMAQKQISTLWGSCASWSAFFQAIFAVLLYPDPEHDVPGWHNNPIKKGVVSIKIKRTQCCIISYKTIFE